jgi:aldehyde dehydrogenase (NAD+)
MSDQFGIKAALQNLFIQSENLGTSTGNVWINSGKEYISSYSPADGALIGKVQVTDSQTYEQVIAKSQEAFAVWRNLPAPQRGEIVRQIGNALRDVKQELGKLVSYEMGKSYQEGLGEVQEMIDICDFAVGLSRQLIWTDHAFRASRTQDV